MHFNVIIISILNVRSVASDVNHDLTFHMLIIEIITNYFTLLVGSIQIEYI